MYLYTAGLRRQLRPALVQGVHGCPAAGPLGAGQLAGRKSLQNIADSCFNFEIHKQNNIVQALWLFVSALATSRVQTPSG